MNILPKKKWHVRTKENMARVRRDEAEAAKKEESRLERVKLAEQERRLQKLRSTTTDDVKEDSTKKDPSSSTVEPSTSKHINFFEELEQQERKNMTSDNKDYQAEKKAEQHAWESKMGIMKKFAEDTMELNGSKNWWETYERIDPEEERKKKQKTVEKEQEKQKKVKKSKKKHRKRRHSSSSDSDDGEAKKRRLEQLRAERLARENAEKEREKKLFKK